MWSLNHKRILITGGTKGIGRAAVMETLKLGAEVLFTVRNEAEIVSFEQELHDAGLAAAGLVSDIANAENRRGHQLDREALGSTGCTGKQRWHEYP